MTKSALAVARQALAAARDALPAYASKFSRKDYTQHQLFACLAVRQFLRADYRGLAQHLKDWAELREAAGLGGRAPGHATLHRAAARLLEKKGPTPCWRPPSPAPGRAA